MATVNFYSKEQTDDKLSDILPSTVGASEGQVLGLDANLEPAWIDASPSSIEIDLTSELFTMNLINTRSGTGAAKYSSNSVSKHNVSINGFTFRTNVIIPAISNPANTYYYTTGYPTALINWLNSLNGVKDLPEGFYYIIFSGLVGGEPLPLQKTSNGFVGRSSNHVIESSSSTLNTKILDIYQY